MDGWIDGWGLELNFMVTYIDLPEKKKNGWMDFVSPPLLIFAPARTAR